MPEKFEVVWPLAKSAQKPQGLAPRLDTLNGKTLCGIWNGVFYFEKTWPMVKEALARKYPGVKFVDWEKMGLFYGPHETPNLEALPEKLKQYKCDAVISGRGC
ncbi:MAG: hypothetical protein HYX90_10565 [Chloroflexi bacterium]|nr:hypothetical protein [Chloroflexota bacterium]